MRVLVSNNNKIEIVDLGRGTWEEFDRKRK